MISIHPLRELVRQFGEFIHLLRELIHGIRELTRQLGESTCEFRRKF